MRFGHSVRTSQRCLVWALLMALCLNGCSKRQSNAELAAAQGILLLGNGEEPNSLDPHIATTIAEAHILYSLFEGLVSPHPDRPNEIAPGVASRWSYDNEALRYTFTLRTDAQWSDGSPIVADDFKRSVQRALDPNFGTAYPEMFFDIRNAKAYFQNEITDFDSVGIKAPSPHELEITLERPTEIFLQKLKHFAWFPVPVRHLETLGDWRSRSTRWTSVEMFVSNGPFVLSAWNPSSVLEARRSETYWDADNVTLNQIRFFPYEDAQTEYRSFQAQQLHVTDKIPMEALAIADAEQSHQRSDPFFATTYLILNTTSPKFSKIGFREALSLAIDKRSLIVDVHRSGNIATSFTPEGIDGYTPPVSESYNPVKARELLKMAFPSGTAPPQITISVSNNPASRAIAEAVQAMWSEDLGLEISLLNMEAKSLFAALDAGDFEISYLLWSGDYADPVSFLDLWSSDNSKNRARWKDPRYDALLRTASTTPDSSARFAALSKAESLLLNQYPIIPIIWRTKNYCVHPTVQNWPPALLDMRSYKNVHFSTTP